MATKMIKFCAALLLTLHSSAYANLEQSAPRAPYTPAQYLKNFALSTCLAYGLDEKEAKAEANAASGGYLELGSFSFEAHEAAAALARAFLAKPYQSKHGGKLTVMKCIDLFHSKELEQLAQKYQRQNQVKQK